MTGLLNPESSEIRHCFGVILVVYLGDGSFHPVCSIFYLSPNQVLGEVLSSRMAEPQKEKVVHLYRSTRLKKNMFRLDRQTIPCACMGCHPCTTTLGVPR